MRAIRQGVVLVGRELRQIGRDPITLALTLFAPLFAAVIASAAFGSPTRVEGRVVVAVPGRAPEAMAQEVAKLVPVDARSGDALRWEVIESADEARRMAEDGDADAALLLPPPDAAPDTPVTVVANRNARLVSELASSGAQALGSRIRLAALLGAPPTLDSNIEVHVVTPDRDPLNGAELYGPVIAIFFLFLTTGIVARGLQNERELGTLYRLRSLPIGLGAIVTSKVATMLIVGIVEIVIVFAAMGLFYSADWGETLAVLAVLIALFAAVGAIALVLASFAAKSLGVHVLELPVALGLTVLGGYLIPIQHLPDAASQVAGLLPNGIAIAALRDISANGDGLGDVAGAVLAIWGFAIVLAAIGYVRLRRAVET